MIEDEIQLFSTGIMGLIYPYSGVFTGFKMGVAKAQAEQVRSVAIERIGRRLGLLPAPP
jgi:hypothetical protein